MPVKPSNLPLLIFNTFQWAKIILVVEQTVTTEERIKKQILYSQPMSDDGGRALVIRWHQSVSCYLLNNESNMCEDILKRGIE